MEPDGYKEVPKSIAEKIISERTKKDWLNSWKDSVSYTHLDEKTGELIMSKDKMMTEDAAAKVAAIVNARPTEADRRIKIRSLLDVYKRQEGIHSRYNVALCQVKIALIVELPRFVKLQSVFLHPVSYTHLDVYKRQPLGKYWL